METTFKTGDRVKVTLPTGEILDGTIRGKRDIPAGLMEPEYDINYREDDRIYIMMRVPESKITTFN